MMPGPSTTPLSAKSGSVRFRSGLTLLLCAGLVAACGSSTAEMVAGPGDLGHVHDLVVDADGTLLVASHTGLWRIDDRDRAVLVGTERHDLMAMTSEENGALLVSGHPDLRVEDYRVDDRPPFLGLTRSSDGGESWQVLDLLGDADFHALARTDEGLYGAETAGRIWFLDHGGTWTELGEVEARDLAIDPSDPNRQLAPDYDGTVWVSADGAATWGRLDDAPALVEIEWPEPGTIVGIDEEGAVWVATSVDSPWEQSATVPAGVETFHVDDAGSWWVSVRGGSITHSDDEGGSWSYAYVPPVRS